MASDNHPAHPAPKPHADAQAPAISGLSVEGYKSIRDPIELQVRGLTLLAGPNSAGKSSALQPLLLLKQTLEATHDPGPLLLDGPCVKVSRAQELFWQGGRKADRAREWSTTILCGPPGHSSYLRSTFGIVDGRLAVTETRMDFPDLPGARAPISLRRGMPDDELRVAAARLSGQHGTVDQRRAVLLEERAMLSVAFEAPFVAQRILGHRLGNHEAVMRAIHLPGLRGTAERAYPITGVRGLFPGPFSPYTASVLLDWQERHDPRIAAVGKDLAHLGLTWKVAPHRHDDTRVELRVGRLPAAAKSGANDLVNIADVGVGTSQVLPVLVALHAAQPGQVVHIEQPEIHLHPNAQVKMADLLVAASNRGVRVIAETHSSVLLRALQLAVAKEEIPAKDVALYWFQREPDGATKMTPGTLGRDGAYGDWPVDFADVEMALDERFIEAAFRQIEPE